MLLFTSVDPKNIIIFIIIYLELQIGFDAVAVANIYITHSNTTQKEQISTQSYTNNEGRITDNEYNFKKEKIKK
jgi:uncharacterized membrane protein